MPTNEEHVVCRNSSLIQISSPKKKSSGKSFEKTARKNIDSKPSIITFLKGRSAAVMTDCALGWGEKKEGEIMAVMERVTIDNYEKEISKADTFPPPTNLKVELVTNKAPVKRNRSSRAYDSLFFEAPGLKFNDLTEVLQDEELISDPLLDFNHDWLQPMDSLESLESMNSLESMVFMESDSDCLSDSDSEAPTSPEANSSVSEKQQEKKHFDAGESRSCTINGEQEQILSYLKSLASRQIPDDNTVEKLRGIREKWRPVLDTIVEAKAFAIHVESTKRLGGMAKMRLQRAKVVAEVGR